MTATVWPRARRAQARMLHLDPGCGSMRDLHLDALPTLLQPGDLVVVNDAATLPAELRGTTAQGPVEVRLAGMGAASPASDEITSDSIWTAVLFGAGNWRMRTEDRPSPIVLARGDTIAFAADLHATVVRVSSVSPRLVQLRFDREGAALWAALYRVGRPVQYSYLCAPLALWHVQTLVAARPWAVEMPSAGWSLDAHLLRSLRQRGVGIASVTHAAGLSSTGDPALDALLPLPERFDVPEATVRAIERARAHRGRIVAVGTTVVRALEGCAAQNGCRLRPGPGVTDLRLGPGFVPRVIDGVLTGMHDPGTSHFVLLRAFVPGPLLDAATHHAETNGYRGHEFGDTCLALAE